MKKNGIFIGAHGPADGGLVRRGSGGAGAGNEGDEGRETQGVPALTAELLEGTLKNMDLTFKKEVEKEGHSYTFQRGETKIRLVNYSGEDLWIEVVYDKKITPAQANQWNTEAKYSRCVLLENDGKTSASLEMQLDCIRGVTEGMVRQFLVRFGGELKEFHKFVAK